MANKNIWKGPSQKLIERAVKKAKKFSPSKFYHSFGQARAVGCCHTNSGHTLFEGVTQCNLCVCCSHPRVAVLSHFLLATCHVPLRQKHLPLNRDTTTTRLLERARNNLHAGFWHIILFLKTFRTLIICYTWGAGSLVASGTTSLVAVLTNVLRRPGSR